MASLLSALAIGSGGNARGNVVTTVRYRVTGGPNSSKKTSGWKIPSRQKLRKSIGESTVLRSAEQDSNLRTPFEESSKTERSRHPSRQGHGENRARLACAFGLLSGQSRPENRLGARYRTRYQTRRWTPCRRSGGNGRGNTCNTSFTTFPDPVHGPASRNRD